METKAAPITSQSRWRRWGSLLKQAIAGSEQNYTKGNIDRVIVLLAIPMILEMAMVLSILIAVPGYFYADDILHVMIKDPAVAEYGAAFTRLMFVANLPILLLWMLNGVFRGAGDAATAMRALWIANGVNILLVPLFIYGWGPLPGMGLLGDATTTTTGRSIGVVYQPWHLFKPDPSPCASWPPVICSTARAW